MIATLDDAAPSPPDLRYAFTVEVEVADPVPIGPTPEGVRRIVPILGGRVHGPGVAGRVLAGGADFQLLVGDTVAHLDARYGLELDDGARVYVENRAVRTASAADSAALAAGRPVDPGRVYFRCAPRLTADPNGPWAWVGERLFVGTGVREPHAVIIDVFAVG